jgi:signal transduction histidine kinase
MKKSILPPLDAHTDPKTEFFMAASHQLKSPLAIVQWCLRSVLENPDLDADTKKMLQRALIQADGMGELITDMLRVFKIVHSSAQPVQTAAPVDLNQLLEGCIKQYEPVAAQQGVRIVRGMIEQLPTVLADEAYLKQAVINVLDNAIKYSNAGGTVDITANVQKTMIEITIADHGIGIPEADQGRLFTEFFRGTIAKEKTANGTGLGLVLVKHIAEGMGGSVSCRSVAGRGTAFTIKLPTEAY